VTRPWRSWAAAMACLVVPWVARAPLVARQATARELPAPLRAAREVTGGARWDEIREITAEGTKTSFGLTGRFRSREDLATGEFEARADYGLLANGEGVDRAGR